MLFVDTFTNFFSPDVGTAAVRVLEEAGFAVHIPPRQVCCGLTWISTGQLDGAKRVAAKTVAALTPALDAGMPIVGLEPSCTATLRSDFVELLGTPAAKALAETTRTLAEVLTTSTGWEPPDLTGVSVVAQPHCHHSSVMGWASDAALLARSGVDVTRLGGCCGLAGNFGVERGHYDVSVAVAENALLPAVRGASPDTVLLADGFSCRTQLADLAHAPSVHLAQLLAGPRD
jgi:Fe-S oxidoreductase